MLMSCDRHRQGAADCANSCVILSSSRNADSISSDRTTNLLPQMRCDGVFKTQRTNTNPASKNARIDYYAGVLIASAAFNLGWTLENTSQSLSAVSIADTSSGERKSYWSLMWRQCTGLSVMRVIASYCSLSAQTISSAHWSS